MALSWMSALKVIPWGDVIEAAPALVKGARKVFTRAQQTEATVEAAAAQPDADRDTRIARLEAQLAELAEQQQVSARLVESLAEQNAKVVEAIEVLRARSRLLGVVCGVLAVALVATVAWSTR